MPLRQLYGNATLDLQTLYDVMSNVSVAMITTVRTHYTKGPHWGAKGIAWITTTCVRINWGWLAFPAVMIGRTGVFMILVVIDNHAMDRERLWKSSVLATLFCEVDHGVEGNAHLASRRAMYDVAKSTSVCLERADGTLRLLAR